MKDCDSLFEKLARVFFKKEPCGVVAMEDYDDFLDSAAHYMAEDSVSVCLFVFIHLL